MHRRSMQLAFALGLALPVLLRPSPVRADIPSPGPDRTTSASPETDERRWPAATGIVVAAAGAVLVIVLAVLRRKQVAPRA